MLKRFTHMVSRVRTQERLGRFIVARFLWKSGLAGRLKLTTDCGPYKLAFVPTSLSAAYWHNPRVREHDERTVAALLHPGGVMVDVGANLGALSLRGASVVGESGRVFAIEPHPTTFGYLTQNVALNRANNVVPLNVAVGREEGVAMLSDKEHDDQNSITVDRGVPVRCTTLDALLDSQVASIDLLKVDVEGFEKFVFEGAPRVLAKTRVVYFESCEAHFQRFGYTTREVLDVLRAAGFQIQRQHGDERVPVPADYVSHELEDLLAVRADASL